MEKKKNFANTINRYRVETVFDACKYKGCTNRRVSKGGMHLYRFPTCGDPRLLTWIKNTGNNLILNWSITTLRKAGICGEHFTEDSFLTPDRTKLKPDAVPKPCGGSGHETVTENEWDHTYAKQEEEEVEAEFIADDSSNNLDLGSETRKSKCIEKTKILVTHPTISLPQRKTPWKSNPTFIRTYSRKLTFKDSDDAMEWTAIEPGCAEDNLGELKATEALKQSVAVDKTVAAEALVTEHENPEITELRIINRELRRQNKMLRIENFKLQMRLVTSDQSKSQR